MKIRIKGNTVRYRLSKTEVVMLAETGLLEEQTTFINNTLTYSVRQTESPDLSADFTYNTITLFVPKTTLQKWADTDQVGIGGQTALPAGRTLQLLLEKDFKCIDAGIKEDQTDYFENPQLTC